MSGISMLSQQLNGGSAGPIDLEEQLALLLQQRQHVEAGIKSMTDAINSTRKGSMNSGMMQHNMSRSSSHLKRTHDMTNDTGMSRSFSSQGYNFEQPQMMQSRQASMNEGVFAALSHDYTQASLQPSTSSAFTKPLAVSTTFTSHSPLEWLSQADNMYSACKRHQPDVSSAASTMSPPLSYAASQVPSLSSSFTSPSSYGVPDPCMQQSLPMSRHLSSGSSFCHGVDRLHLQSDASHSFSEDEMSIFPSDVLSKKDISSFTSLDASVPTFNDNAFALVSRSAGMLSNDVDGQALLAQVGGFTDNSEQYIEPDSWRQSLATNLEVPSLNEVAMERTSSQESSSSSRTRKHLENSMLQGNIQPMPSKSVRFDSECKAPKQMINKAPCRRKKRQPLMCPHCNHRLQGYHGQHELDRHIARAHPTNTKRVWVCRQPENPTGQVPPRKLDICKQCKDGKQYNVYYNAACHIRRAHFYPKKRGRRARGEEKESRAGKAGGDQPAIDWLKAQGYIKEIEVLSTDPKTIVSENPPPMKQTEVAQVEVKDEESLADDTIDDSETLLESLPQELDDLSKADNFGLDSWQQASTDVDEGTDTIFDDNWDSCISDQQFSTAGLHLVPDEPFDSDFFSMEHFDLH